MSSYDPRDINSGYHASFRGVMADIVRATRYGPVAAAVDMQRSPIEALKNDTYRATRHAREAAMQAARMRPQGALGLAPTAASRTIAETTREVSRPPRYTVFGDVATAGLAHAGESVNAQVATVMRQLSRTRRELSGLQLTVPPLTATDRPSVLSGYDRATLTHLRSELQTIRADVLAHQGLQHEWNRQNQTVTAALAADRKAHELVETQVAAAARRESRLAVVPFAEALRATSGLDGVNRVLAMTSLAEAARVEQQVHAARLVPFNAADVTGLRALDAAMRTIVDQPRLRDINRHLSPWHEPMRTMRVEDALSHPLGTGIATAGPRMGHERGSWPLAPQAVAAAPTAAAAEATSPAAGTDTLSAATVVIIWRHALGLLTVEQQSAPGRELVAQPGDFLDAVTEQRSPGLAWRRRAYRELAPLVSADDRDDLKNHRHDVRIGYAKGALGLSGAAVGSVITLSGGSSAPLDLVVVAAVIAVAEAWFELTQARPQYTQALVTHARENARNDLIPERRRRP